MHRTLKKNLIKGELTMELMELVVLGQLDLDDLVVVEGHHRLRVCLELLVQL